jgi:predicted dehydrogenase
VLLLRPFAVDTTALRRLATLAARHSVQFHLARTSRFALGHGAARGLVAAGGAGASSAMVETRLQSPRPLAAPELLHDLLDEADFASAVLGGEVVRALAAGGSRCLPGRWMDRRMYLELDGENGVRRGLTLALTVERGPAAAKASQILVRGSRGSASLAALPVAGCDPLDLDAFLAAVRCRQPGPGLTLQRLLNLTDRVLASIPP